MKLKNKVSLITGASQGLGKAIAHAFLKEGAHVAICARDSNLIESVADELRAHSVIDQKVFAATCDVSSFDQVERLFSDLSDWLGSVEILVNNAGVYGPKGGSENVPFEEWARAIDRYPAHERCRPGEGHQSFWRRGDRAASENQCLRGVESGGG
jgi:NAD(P)-dependent dehydrogenase (short-subunit alcohol dehydrogenase family)